MSDGPMEKRLIAAMMLLSLWCGAASSAFGLLTMSHVMPRAANQTSAGHRCCPGLHWMNPELTQIAATVPAMPCGDEHPCCAKRAPESPASLPAATEGSRHGVLELAAEITLPALRLRNDRPTSNTPNDLPLPAYFSRSTVLRI